MPIGERGKITTITDLSGNTYDLGAMYDVNGNKIASTYAKLTDIPDKGMVILSYGSSTWAEFKAAYDDKNIVYCRASSNSNPASGSQTRLAFMAYVDNASNPTNVEFQYYRSVSTHSDSQQGDQVYVYKLTSAGAWSVTVRENYTKVAAGTGLSGSWSNGTYTTKAALVSETNLTDAAEATTESSVNVYPVAPDSNGKLAVVVPDDKAFIATRIVTRSDMESLPYALSEGEIVFAEDGDGGLVLLRVLEDFSIGDTNFDIDSGSATETVGDMLQEYYNQIYGGGVERTSNKVTSLSPSSTDAQYPSAKAVYDFATGDGKRGLIEHVGKAFGDLNKHGYYASKIIHIENSNRYSETPIVFQMSVDMYSFANLVLKFDVASSSPYDLSIDEFYCYGESLPSYYAKCSSNTCDIYMISFGSNAVSYTISDVYTDYTGMAGITITYPNESTQYNGSYLKNTLGCTEATKYEITKLITTSKLVTSLSSSSTNSQAPSAKAVYDTFLPLSGGLDSCMTGYLYMRNTDVTKGTNPSSDAGRSIRVMHNDAGTTYSGNDVLGQLLFTVTSAGYSQATLMAYRNAANTAHWAAIRAQIASNGTANPYFVTNTGTTVVNTIWHTGNAPNVDQAYANASKNSSLTLTNYYTSGVITNSSKRIRFFVPYNVIGGTASISALSIMVFGAGVCPYVRSGSSGQTYTQLGTSNPVSIWENSATKRTNEVSSVNIVAKVRSGFFIYVDFNYAITASNNTTAIQNYSTVFIQLTASITLSSS